MSIKNAPIEKMVGTIDRIGFTQMYFEDLRHFIYFTIEGHSMVFILRAQETNLCLSRPGDKVAVEYRDCPNGRFVYAMENSTLGAKASDINYYDWPFRKR